MDVQKRRSRSDIWIRRVAVAGLLVSIFAAVGFSVSYLTNVDPIIERDTVIVDEVKFGTLVHEIRSVGKLVAEQAPWVSARADGRVAKILVLPGVKVTSDTVLVELTNPDLRLSLINAQSTLDAAKAKLKSERATLLNQQRALQSSMVKLKSEYQQAQAEYEVTQSLSKRNIEPKHKVRISRIKAESLKEQFDVATESFHEFKDNFDDQLAVFAEEITQAKAKRDLEQTKIDALVVHASFDGVLVDVPVEVGQQVLAGEVLATLVDPSQLKAELQVPEVQSRYIRIGQIARVDTHFGIVDGKVTRIDSSVVDGTITIDVSFDGQLPADTRPNLSVTGMVEVGRLEEVLHVGRPAGVLADSDVELFRVDTSKRFAVRIPGKVGAASVNAVELREGFSAGDRLILSDMNEYAEHDRVRLN